MPEPLEDALSRVRELLLDPERLIRAVAGGRRRGTGPVLVKAELRPVQLKSGPRVQVVTSDGTRPSTRNVPMTGLALASAVDELIGVPFGNWRIETLDQVWQIRVTKRGEAMVHVTQQPNSQVGPTAQGQGHDRVAEHLLAPDDPLFDVIGGSSAKRRQVDAFLRALAATIDLDYSEKLRVVDLGCGNAYLTFAAYRYLYGLGLDVTMTGIDVREDQRERNTAQAAKLGWSDRVRFVAGTIAQAEVEGADLALALHACDTATDEALARAVGWQARWILAAPCCHHDVAAQLRAAQTPTPYESLTRHGILRERFADVLTDALRAAQLRMQGYRVEVVEFIDSAHTPRNVLLRASYSGAAPTSVQRAEYANITSTWHVKPALEKLLAQLLLSTSTPDAANGD